MKRLIAFLLIVMSAPLCMAASENAPLDPVYINLTDKASLQRGARTFINYCLSCHSATYMRYRRMAEDLDISEELLQENLMFASDKPGDLMRTTMPADYAKDWFGVVPPDLTLIARVRNPDWIYTFLRSFYRDDGSQSGWNNGLLENTAMPHVLYGLQGDQRLVTKSGEDDGKPVFRLEKPGTKTPEEYDNVIRDLANFLVYLGEPIKLERYLIGVFVMLFLAVLLVLSYLLKKEYWKDVH
jgi:ubiquinol-cytochrome c reductase cytochrome c1 subunit